MSLRLHQTDNSFFTSGHCQSRWIRVPVMPQPCQHKSEALQFILYIFCGVMYDLNRILSCISFMVSHSSSNVVNSLLIARNHF
uniref:Uncharacterized protein n=1 Tax=Neogobius melanostomus TaxID=47308 RepID=A0A8C6SYV9_9GOBI